MSAIVVVNAAEERFLDAILATNYTLRLYKNNVTSGLTPTQIEALAVGSFTEADFAGYASVALTGGSWTTTQDDPSTGSYAQQTFTRSSTGTAQQIYGYYVTRTTGGALEWFEHFDAPITVENLGDAIVVTPKLTLDDGEDSDMVARGLVAEFVSTSNGSSLVADGVTDFAINNVPVVAGRHYKIHLHSQYNMPDGGAGLTDQRWNLLFRVNGSTVDRFETVYNDSDAVGTDSAKTDTTDSWVDWEPSVTQSTDDIDMYADNTSGTPSLQFQATATAVRWLRVYDMGLAV